MAGHHMPATRTINVHVHYAHLRVDLLPFEDCSRRPQTSRYRGFLKETHLNIRGIERFIFCPAILHLVDQIILIHHLPVRQSSREVVTVHAPEKCSVILHDSPRRLALQIDYFLPLHFWIRGRAVGIVGIAGILRVDRGYQEKQRQSEYGNDLYHAGICLSFSQGNEAALELRQLV